MQPHDWIYTTLGAVITAVLSIAIMIIKHFLFKDSKRFDEGSQIRTELRVRCKELEVKIDALNEENDRWRLKYYKDTQELNALNMSLKHDLATMQIQLNDIKERFIPKKHKESYA